MIWLFVFVLIALLLVLTKLLETYAFVRHQANIEGILVPKVEFIKSLSESDKFDWFEVASQFKLCAKYYLYKGDMLSVRIFSVKKGYVTNFISTLRIFWPIIPPHGRGAVAACVHDFLYENHYERPDQSSNHDYRREYDIIFLVLLINSKVPMWQCYVMYCYVRAFGWVKFKTKEKPEDSSSS